MCIVQRIISQYETRVKLIYYTRLLWLDNVGKTAHFIWSSEKNNFRLCCALCHLKILKQFTDICKTLSENHCTDCSHTLGSIFKALKNIITRTVVYIRVYMSLLFVLLPCRFIFIVVLKAPTVSIQSEANVSENMGTSVIQKDLPKPYTFM